MDDLTTMLNQIMSDPEAMNQIQSIASSLGLGGESGGAEQPPAGTQSAGPNNQNSGGGADLSALASLLGNLQQPAPAPPVQNSAPDLSALASLLGGLQNPAPAPPVQNSAPDLSSLAGILGGLGAGKQQSASTAKPDISALTSLLGGGSAPAQAPGGGFLPNIDVSTIMKLSQALASVQSNKANIDLLLALKPRLKDERSKKVDDAIRVMQLIQFLPLIKESGLFGEMDGIVSKLAGSGGGGLGGLLGNVGNGLGGLLGGLGRR